MRQAGAELICINGYRSANHYPSVEVSCMMDNLAKNRSGSHVGLSTVIYIYIYIYIHIYIYNFFIHVYIYICIHMYRRVIGTRRTPVKIVTWHYFSKMAALCEMPRHLALFLLS